MSVSLSLDASKTPTPPATAKLNGSIPPLRLAALNMSAYQLQAASNNSSGLANGVIGNGATTPNLMTTPTNVTINSTKALLDLSRGSLHLPPVISPANTAGSPTRRQPLLLGTSSSSPRGHYEEHQKDIYGVSPTNSTPVMKVYKGIKEEASGSAIYQTLASLALLCLLSLLMSFLALFFLQKVGPPVIPTQLSRTSGQSEKKSRSENGGNMALRVVISSEEYFPVYQVTVALSTLTMALNLCCLFVCCIQFLFAIKLLKTSSGEERTNKFLKRSSTTRVIAIGGFFLSIPVFFTGVILFTFIHFQEVPAIATSVAIGVGIVFCGVASVQNVYLWQWEKTRASRELLSKSSRFNETLCSATAPDVTVHTMELSTLV